MRTVWVFLCLVQGCLLGLAQGRPDAAAGGPGLSYAEWTNACAKLPANRALGERMPPKNLLPLQEFGALDAVLTDFFALSTQGTLGKTNAWVGERPTAEAFYNTSTAYFLKPTASSAPYLKRFIPRPLNAESAPMFQPFAARVRVPEGGEIFFHADLHGDIRSLLGNLAWLNREGYLTGFQIAKPDFHMVFFGDYADRGRYGVEVLYTLLRLKLANPDRVFLLRGNHEEFSIAARYGFLSEGIVKYGAAFDVQKVVRAYDFFPAVLYIGTSGSYIQCHHGGMEPGFDPRALLDALGDAAFQFLGVLNQQQFLKSHPEWTARWPEASQSLAQRGLQDFRPLDPIVPSTLGFMWNDFSVLPDEPDFNLDPGRAYVYGPQATRYLLAKSSTDKNSLKAVFRGHQQSSQPNPLMNRIVASHGIYRHWQAAEKEGDVEAHLEKNPIRPVPAGSVWTFNVAPDSVYGEGNQYNFDSFGILKTAREFADWKLRVVNVETGH
ncbi:MAG TPA: metallophosphoesterase family protein [Candidatus Limnocylindria bacterium]|nr:metallophosphoesterase family protein [Candidatus Limnocylindria bacterium]